MEICVLYRGAWVVWLRASRWMSRWVGRGYIGYYMLRWDTFLTSCIRTLFVSGYNLKVLTGLVIEAVYIVGKIFVER